MPRVYADHTQGTPNRPRLLAGLARLGQRPELQQRPVVCELGADEEPHGSQGLPGVMPGDE